MKAMNRFIRWHPIWSTVIGAFVSLLLIVSCIYGGMKINKHIHPNDIYYTKEGLIYNGIPYVQLLSQWEFIERPTKFTGELYDGGKYGLIHARNLFRYQDDTNAVFLEAPDKIYTEKEFSFFL